MHSYLHNTHPTYILAHRGGVAGTAIQENSLEAFKRAVELGYTYLETDVRLAKDGVLYLSHGSTSLLPNRLLKVGKNKPATLSELFDLYPTCYFAIDPKHTLAIKPLAKLIATKDMASQVCLGASFDHRAKRIADLVEQASGRRPTTALVSLLATIRLLLRAYGLPVRIHSQNASFIHIYYRLVHPRVIKTAHDLGLKIIAWVVNDQQTMEKLLAWEIDGFMTDYPKIANQALRNRANHS